MSACRLWCVAQSVLMAVRIAILLVPTSATRATTSLSSPQHSSVQVNSLLLLYSAFLGDL